MTTNRDRSSMPDKLNKRGRQTTFRESDSCIVPLTTEDQSVETKLGNSNEGKAAGILRDPDRTPPAHSDGESVLNRLDRITTRAKTHPEEVFNNLFSLLNYELLWYAFSRLKRGKVPGVDGVTVESYEANLRANLQDLLGRLHRGSYRPQPSLRKNIPKGNGKTRPLGIATIPGNSTSVQRAFGFGYDHTSVSSVDRETIPGPEIPSPAGRRVPGTQRFGVRNLRHAERMDRSGTSQ